MNRLRAWLLIKLAHNDSVVLNTIVNQCKTDTPLKEVTITWRGQSYQVGMGELSALELRRGALVSGCTFRRQEEE